jgi:YD repeat-containing protein
MGITINRLYSEVGKPQYTTLLDYDGSNKLIYIGLASPSSSTDTASWRISKLYYNSNSDISGMRFADGNSSFDNVWVNRATLTYV